MEDERLLKQYSGEGARSYDRTRGESDRFRAEEAAFTELFAIARPTSVLDCPFGTGRWISHYKDSAAQVVGIDLSADMLKEAQSKVDSAGLRNVRLVQGSIFDQGLFGPQLGRFNLAVCVRFLNWIESSKLREGMRNLDRVAQNHVIIGVSVVPSKTSFLRRLRMRRALSRINALRIAEGKSPQHVHREDSVLSCFASLQWEPLRRIEIFENETRVNYFYLLRVRRH